MIQWPSGEVALMWDRGDFLRGCTEPWTAQLVANMASAINAKNIVETGTFLGTTTAFLMAAVSNATADSPVMISTCDLNVESIREAEATCLGVRHSKHVHVNFYDCDAIEMIRRVARPIDFAFIDDDHTADHVSAELDTLIPLMREGGIICLHDVIGPLGLDKVVRDHGGFCIDLPRIHAAGGLGVIQV